MTKEQRELVSDLTLDRIPIEDFIVRFGMDPRISPGFGLPMLREALNSKDRDQVYSVLSLIYRFDGFEGWTREFVPILCELLVEPWHFSHEDIASELQVFKDERSIEALYKTAFAKHEYLGYNNSYALARKCVWALADIGSADAKAKLEKIRTEADEEIAGYARRRLARWDMELHRKGRQ